MVLTVLDIVMEKMNGEESFRNKVIGEPVRVTETNSWKKLEQLMEEN